MAQASGDPDRGKGMEGRGMLSSSRRMCWYPGHPYRHDHGPTTWIAFTFGVCDTLAARNVGRLRTGPLFCSPS